MYIHTQDKYGNVHVSLVTSKTKVAPIKQLTIPRLELCGAQLLAKLLYNTKLVLKVPMQDIYAWTDSTIVLSWLIGNPRRFKTFVGNRVSSIMQLIPPERWSHVESADNLADCSSRGLFPSELIRHELWWNSPDWLRSLPTQWPRQYVVPAVEVTTEERGNACLHIVTYGPTPLIPLDQSSSSLHLKRVTAWVLRFISNCRNRRSHNKSIYLTTDELRNSERYWALFTQEQAFQKEMEILREENSLPPSSRLFTLHPFIDSFSLLRVGGRGRNTDMEPSVVHPIILPGKHPITSLIVSSEHRRLMHAGPTLLTVSLNRRYHIIGYRKIVRSITQSCVTCRRTTVKPNPQVLGQLPPERLTPDSVFSRVGVDYAGPFTVKYGPTRKPKLVKTYGCVFVSLTIKAVHLELVSDLTTDTFIATLRRFIARRGKPTLIWSDHGTNFVGAARELKDFIAFFQNQKTQGFLSEFRAA